MNFITNISFVLLMLTATALTSCGGSATTASDSTEQSDAEAKTGKEYTSAYVCPMHCQGSGSAEPGQCPVCKMDYVAIDELKDHDHDHEHDHDHDHGDHDHDH